MDKEIRYFVNGYEMLLYLSGDREERKSVDCFELQDFESEEKAVAAARDFISEHKNAVNDQKHGMNSICFDTETTGLHPNGSDPDEILTISIIGRDGSVLLDERFRPTVKTEWPHASAVNGIYPEDVADLPTIETAIPRLREIFAGADEIIGYNVGFDLGFLSAVGVRPREDARITDTMNEFTWFMGRRYKLVDAADHIGYEWTGRAHGSLADALATLAVQRWLEQWLVAE